MDLITIPSQGYDLGLYYMTKEKKSTEDNKVKGEGMIFYSLSEVKIAFNEGVADLHAKIKVRFSDDDTRKIIN